MTDANDSGGNGIDNTGDADTTDETDADLEQGVERFLRDARRVYEEYEDDYLDPDAALWTIEGHIDSLEDALNAHTERDSRDDRD